MTDYDNLADTLAEQDANGSSDDDYDNELPDEAEDAPIVNVTPQCALGFEEIVDVGMAGGIKDEQNIRVANGFTNDLVVTIRNPSVEDGTLWAATNGAAADYKLVDMDNADVEVDVEKDGDDFTETGVRVYGNSFESEEVYPLDLDEDEREDERGFDEEYAKLFIGSAAGMRLAMQLDCRGGESAYYEGDDKTSGLVEYPPRYSADDYNPSDDGYPRLARTPTLRDDLRGEEGVLFFYLSEEHSFNGNAMHMVTTFKGEADPDNALSPPTADDEVGEPQYPPFLVWDEPDDGEGADGDTDDSDVDMGALDTDDDTTVESVDDLPTEHQQFVEKARDSIDPSETDVSVVYEQFCTDNGLDHVGEEIVVDAIEG